MRLLFVTLFSLAVIISFSQTSSELLKKDINGKVSLLVPENFIQLTEQDLVQGFGMVHLPEASFASPNKDITLTVAVRSDSINSAINYQSTKGKKDSIDLVIEKSFYKASLGALYSEIKFIKDEITTIDKRPFMIFEFESTLVGKTAKGTETSSKQYNYIAHGYKGKYKYIITFASPLELKTTWQPIAQEIFASIKI